MAKRTNNISRIEGKLDMILEYQKEFSETTRNHDIRIRSLEKSRSRLLGWVAGVGAVVTTLFSVFKGET